jgi:hypothetical protein
MNRKSPDAQTPDLPPLIDIPDGEPPGGEPAPATEAEAEAEDAERYQRKDAPDFEPPD